MNLRLALKLMTIPTFMGSVVMLGIPTEGASAVNASHTMTLTTIQATCEMPSARDLKSSTMRHQNQSITIASAGAISGETAILDFSAAESDAAAILFGCDCTPCINALRQLRKPSLLNNGGGSGHCWTSLQRRVSPQKVQEVLQNLDRKEAEPTPSVVR